MALNQLTLQMEHMELDQIRAAAKGNVAWLQYILQNNIDVNGTDSQGFAAIHFAVYHGKFECLKLLVENYNANVNLPSKAGWRPIHLALNKKNRSQALNCVHYLIEKGADLDVYAEKKLTPLHQAAREGLHECIAALIQAGADVHAKDSQGHKPIDVCKLWSQRTCARYLSNWMWKKDKENIAQETQRLNKLKSNLQEDEQKMFKAYKKDHDNQCLLAFNKWLEIKHFPEHLKTTPTYQKWHPSHSKASTGKLTSTFFTLKKIQKQGKGCKHLYPVQDTHKPVVPKMVKSQEEKPGGMSQLKDKSHLSLNSHEENTSVENQKSLQPEPGKEKQMWNYSTKTSTPPVSNIFRPTEIRLGTAPEQTRDHDLRFYVSLSKDKQGKPKITAAAGHEITPVPKLSYDFIKKSLFPESVPQRILMPQEFKATYVFDVERRRSPMEPQRPVPEVAFHLRETLESKHVKES